MDRPFRFLHVLALLLATLVLAGCKSDDEKAEDFFRSGMALLDAGDPDRAIVEFRNVFKHDGFHREARETFAALLMERGEVSKAVAQYLRLVEQYPEALEARQILAETAIFGSDWEEARRHANAAKSLAPDDERSIALGLALDYRAAILDREDRTRAEIALRARTMLDDGTQNLLLTLTVTDHLSKTGAAAQALPYIDRALENDPAQFDLHIRKFRLLSDTGDDSATGAQLHLMSRLFPDNADISNLLISWYISRDDVDGAEVFLRARASEADAGTAAQTTLVGFLLDKRGPEAATAELDRLIRESNDTETRAIFSRLSARVDLEQGDLETAEARLRAMLAEDGFAPHERAPAQVLLAQILDRQNYRDEAIVLIEALLKESPNNADALKMRAGWNIEDNTVGAAIVDLRAALEQNPRDPNALVLMALAHERLGDTELAAERLSLAVEVSNDAPPQALRYAEFVAERGRFKIAATVLGTALRKSPGNLELQSALANVYLKQQDWTRAQAIAQQLREIGTPEAKRSARFLQAAILTGQDRIEESLTFLQSQIASSSEDAEKVRAAVLIVQNLLRSDRLESALTFASEQVAENPDSLEMRLLRGNLLALNGDMEAAEAIYRALIDDAPDAEVPILLLLTVLFATEKVDEGRAVLDASLARMPESVELNWAKATLLEREGDLAGAAAIYETLYQRDTSNIIAANNYVSLLVAQTNDPEAVERAYAVARRLKDENIPQFQDTYGWILHLRGESSAALPHLETALAGLPNDPSVNYHIGAVYAVLGRTEAARERLERAVALFDNSATKPAQDARALLESLP